MKWSAFIPIIRGLPPIPQSQDAATETGAFYFCVGWADGFIPPGMPPRFLPSYFQGFRGAVLHPIPCRCRRRFLALWN